MSEVRMTSSDGFCYKAGEKSCTKSLGLMVGAGLLLLAGSAVAAPINLISPAEWIF